jgi:hypothetical protein
MTADPETHDTHQKSILFKTFYFLSSFYHGVFVKQDHFMAQLLRVKQFLFSDASISEATVVLQHPFI